MAPLPALPLATGDDGFVAGSGTSQDVPDPTVAVSDKYIVHVNNTAVVVCDRPEFPTSSHPMSGPNDFWGSLTPDESRVFDPEVVWDPQSGRFFIVGSYAPMYTPLGTHWILAVSKTSNPTIGQGGNPSSAWWFYTIGATALDSPNIALDDTALMLSGDSLVTGQDRFEVRTFPKAPFLAGTPVQPTGAFTFPGWLSFGTPMVHGTAGRLFLVEADLLTSVSQVTIHEITNPATAPTLTSYPPVAVASYGDPGRAPHVGGTDLELFDARFWSSVWRNGSLWCTHHVTQGAGPSVVRWYEFATPPAGPPSLVQWGTVAAPGPNQYAHFPAITVNDDGAAFLVFSSSSSTEYLAIQRTYRLPCDPPGTMRPAAVVRQGQVAYGANRWGDYAAAVADPLDATSFWFTHLLPTTPGPATWNSWVGRFDTAFDTPVVSLSASQGGVAPLSLFNPGHAGRDYVILGSVSGTSPGFPLGSTIVPLNWDWFTEFTIDATNTPTFQGFSGTLDANGCAGASFVLPPNALLPGTEVAFAFVQDGNPWDYASKAICIRIDP